MDQLIQTVGAVGVLAAFVGQQTGRLDGSSRGYLALNAAGAGLLTASAIIERQWGFLLLEGTWTIVALVGLVRTRITR